MIPGPFVRLVPLLALALAPLHGQAETNVEEARLPDAYAAMGSVLAPARDHTHLLIDTVDRAASDTDPAEAARAAGQRLWRSAREQAQQHQLDDRPLYWSRLAAKHAFRQRCQSAKTCESALNAFESASRGIFELTFVEQTDMSCRHFRFRSVPARRAHRPEQSFRRCCAAPRRYDYST